MLAGAVVVAHVAFILFVAFGGLLVVRWRRLALLHVPGVAYALLGLTVGVRCPLTTLEKWLRVRAGEPVYQGGFVDRYIEGVIFPVQAEVYVRAFVVALILCSYAGAALRMARSRRAARPSPALSRPALR